MTIRKTVESRGSKSSPALAALLLMVGVLAVQAGDTYYLAVPDTYANDDVLTTPSFWTNVTGVAATEFGVNDTFAFGATLSARAIVPTPSSATVFPGGVLQLGNASARGPGTLNLFGDMTFPLLKLSYGVLLSYCNSGKTNSVHGKIEVLNSTVRWGAGGKGRLRQTQFIDAELVGDSSSVLDTHVRYADSKGDKYESLVLAGDCSGFSGTIKLKRGRATDGSVLSWPDYWAKLELATENFSMPGTVTIAKGCLLDVNTASASIKSLSMGVSDIAPDLSPTALLKILQVPGGNGFKVTQSLTLNSDVTLVVSLAPRTGHATTNVFPVFTVPLSASLDWSRIGIVVEEGPYPVAGSYLTVVTNTTAGTESLSLVEPPVVKLVKTDAKAKEADSTTGADDSLSAFVKAASWSDNETPHSGAEYLMECLDGTSTFLRTKTELTAQTFDGDSLTVGNKCYFYTFSTNLSMKALRLLDGSHLCTGSTVNNGKYARIDAPVEVPPNSVVHLAPYYLARLTFVKPISGSGKLLVEGTDIGSSYRKAITRLAADNSGFFGTIEVKQHIRYDARYTNGQYLEFTDANNLGGPLPTFNGEALTLGDLSALTPLVSVTLDAASNRGLYVTDSGAVNVTNANTTLTLNWPLKVKGTMEKWGPGTLALGGTLTTNGACRLEVRQGAIQPLAPDALNGLTLSFAAGGTLLFDLANLPANGMRNLVETPFELGEGVDKLPIEVKGDRTQMLASVISAPLLTVDSAAVSAATLRAMLPDPPHPYLGCKSEWTVEEDAVAGTVTLGLTLTPRGTTIYMR